MRGLDARRTFQQHRRLLSRDVRTAFDVVWAPVVARASQTLRATLGPRRAKLAASAWDERCRLLLDSCSYHAAPALIAELRSARGRHGRFRSIAAGTTVLHDLIVDDLLTGDLARVLSRGPLLRHRVALAIGAWMGGTAEVICHLDDDRQPLAEWLGHDLGRVTALRDVGDAHDLGRTATAVGVEQEALMVHKPRSLEPDLLVQSVASKSKIDLQWPAMLPRHGWGWCRWVDQEPLPDRAAARVYHLRAGELLALATKLGTHDLHGGNVVATASGPRGGGRRGGVAGDIRGWGRRTADCPGLIVATSLGNRWGRNSLGCQRPNANRRGNYGCPW